MTADVLSLANVLRKATMGECMIASMASHLQGSHGGYNHCGMVIHRQWSQRGQVAHCRYL